MWGRWGVWEVWEVWGEWGVWGKTIQNNYQALLTENHHLKSTLLQLVDDCYCWKSNRCEKCQKILKSLAPETAQKKINTPEEYEAILT